MSHAPSVISPTFLRLGMGWGRVKAVFRASHSPSPRNSIYRTIMPGFPPPRVADRLWEIIITINKHHACLLCIIKGEGDGKRRLKLPIILPPRDNKCYYFSVCHPDIEVFGNMIFLKMGSYHIYDQIFWQPEFFSLINVL